MADDIVERTKKAMIYGTSHPEIYKTAQEEEIERLRAENETLRRDVKTAIMGDSAELQDVKRENEKLRAALKLCVCRPNEIAAALKEDENE